MLLFGIVPESRFSTLKSLLGVNLHEMPSLDSLNTNQIKVKTDSLYSFILQRDPTPVLLSTRIEFKNGHDSETTPVATIWKPSSSPAVYTSAIKQQKESFESPPKTPDQLPAATPNDRIYRASFTPSVQRSILMSQFDQMINNHTDELLIEKPREKSFGRKTTDISLERARKERALQKSIEFNRPQAQMLEQLSQLSCIAKSTERPKSPLELARRNDSPGDEVHLVPVAVSTKLEDPYFLFPSHEGKRLFQEPVGKSTSELRLDEDHKHHLPNFANCEEKEDSGVENERPSSSRSISRIKSLKLSRIERNKTKKELESW